MKTGGAFVQQSTNQNSSKWGDRVLIRATKPGRNCHCLICTLREHDRQQARTYWVTVAATLIKILILFIIVWGIVRIWP
jgi:hypothetical protein